MQEFQNVLTLAPSKSVFDMEPSAFDGFIERKLKRSVDLTVNGKLYTVNTHGVLCSRRILDDGKTWYSFCAAGDELFTTRRDELAFADSLSIGRDAKGLFFK